AAHPTLSYSANSDNTGGILRVSDGTHTANLSLVGQYVGGNFNVADDNAGGTLVYDPPVAEGTIQSSSPSNDVGIVAPAAGSLTGVSTAAITTESTDLVSSGGHIAAAGSIMPILHG